MRELGQTLRHRREELGIDLDELQARTKIRKRYLMAIEEGNWSDLPGEVYARGFVRSYAECVGLDGRHLLEMYGQPSGPERPQRSVPTSAPKSPSTVTDKTTDDSPEAPRSAESKTKKQSPQSAAPLALTNYSNRNGSNRKNQVSARPVRSYGGQVVAVVGILIVLGGGLWAVKRFTTGGAPQPSSPMTPSNITGTAGNQTANTGIGSQSANTQLNATPADNSTNQAAGGITNNSAVNNDTMPGQTDGGQANNTVQITAQPPANGSATYLVSTAAPLQVSITAAERCWVAVTVDGKSADGGGGQIIDSGQTSQWTANQVFKVRVGNVPAAKITVNGQLLSLPATNSPLNIYVMKPQAH